MLHTTIVEYDVLNHNPQILEIQTLQDSTRIRLAVDISSSKLDAHSISHLTTSQGNLHHTALRRA